VIAAWCSSLMEQTCTCGQPYGQQPRFLPVLAYRQQAAAAQQVCTSSGATTVRAAHHITRTDSWMPAMSLGSSSASLLSLRMIWAWRRA